jgi:ABC-type cobalamin transport system ATPase subunit
LIGYLRTQIEKSKEHNFDLPDTPTPYVTTMVGVTKSYVMTDNDWNLVTLHADEFWYERGRTIMTQGEFYNVVVRPNEKIRDFPENLREDKIEKIELI